MSNAKYIEVHADVRYWEDATVNGIEDTDGSLIPFKDGDTWKPVIDLVLGIVVGWPSGVVADIHYKVCDAGEYWLLDENKNRIAKYKDYYVPDEILCVGENGYGDYIIFKVAENGSILGWRTPDIVRDRWDFKQ